MADQYHDMMPKAVGGTLENAINSATWDGRSIFRPVRNIEIRVYIGPYSIINQLQSGAYVVAEPTTADTINMLVMEETDDPSTQNAPVQATNVAKSYNEVRVLEGVSLSIIPGELTALIGPNGSGKSTLLRAIVGLTDIDDGNITRPRQTSNRSFGYLPQRPEFRPGFTVEETLSFYATLLNTDGAETESVLEQVGLSQARETKVEELSGGMIRLLGLAQAILGNPQTIILDEPASGLDPGMREHVFETAKTLTDPHTGVLLTSHDLDLVERFADRVALLDHGSMTDVTRSSSDDEGGENIHLRDIYITETVGSSRSIRVRRESQ